MAARLVGMNATRVIGSLVAGALIARYGVGPAYLFAASGAFVGVGFLVFIQGNFLRVGQNEPFWQSASLGLHYVWGEHSIRKLLLLSLCMEAFGFSHLVMMPVMARDVLHVGATGLGYLSAASGAGSMLSTIAVASLGDFRRKGLLLTSTALGAGISLILFGFSTWFGLSLVLVAAVGACLMSYDVTMGTTLQLLSKEEMRGRVMGVYGLTFGFTPVGGFLAGSVAAVLSASIAVALGGVIILAYVAGIARSIACLNPRG